MQRAAAIAAAVVIVAGVAACGRPSISQPPVAPIVPAAQVTDSPVPALDPLRTFAPRSYPSQVCRFVDPPPTGYSNPQINVLEYGNPYGPGGQPPGPSYQCTTVQVTGP